MFDVGRQAQNMMLAAHAEGVGTCPVTLQHHDVARTAVGLPDDWSMPMAITLGYPVKDHPDSPLKRQRVAMDDLVIRGPVELTPTSYRATEWCLRAR